MLRGEDVCSVINQTFNLLLKLFLRRPPNAIESEKKNLDLQNVRVTTPQ